MPLFESTESKAGATVRLLGKAKPDSSTESGDGLFWWRRGRVELPVQKTLCWNVLQACPALVFLLAASPPAKKQVSQPMDLRTAYIGVRADRTPNSCRLLPVLGARRGQT